MAASTAMSQQAVPQRREIVLSSLSPERRLLVMDMLLSSGASYATDGAGGYTAVLQMQLSSDGPDFSTGQESISSPAEKGPSTESYLQDLEAAPEEEREERGYREDSQAADVSTSGRALNDVSWESRGRKQQLKRLWGQSSSRSRVGSKVMTRWANESHIEEFSLDLVADTAEHFQDVAAALTQPRALVKRKPLSWIVKAIDELFDKRYALEVSEQKAAVDPYAQNRRRSHDSNGARHSDHAQDDNQSQASSLESLEGHASFAVFLLQTYRKKYGLRQLAEGAVWDLLCNVEKAEEEELHPAVSCFAGFLDGLYTSDDLEFFLYCRQKVSSEIQRTLSATPRRSNECWLANALLKKEQTVSMTRAVLGKVAGGPLLAELCHSIELFFESQAESASSRKGPRGASKGGTISAYQYLKLVLESYRATNLDNGNGEDGQSQGLFHEGDGLIYVDDEPCWDNEAEDISAEREEEAQGDLSYLHENDRIDCEDPRYSVEGAIDESAHQGNNSMPLIEARKYDTGLEQMLEGRLAERNESGILEREDDHDGMWGEERDENGARSSKAEPGLDLSSWAQAHLFGQDGELDTKERVLRVLETRAASEPSAVRAESRDSGSSSWLKKLMSWAPI